MCNGKKLEGRRQVPGKKRGHSGRKNVKLRVGSKGVRQIDWHSLHIESRQKRLQTSKLTKQTDGKIVMQICAWSGRRRQNETGTDTERC